MRNISPSTFDSPQLVGPVAKRTAAKCATTALCVCLATTLGAPAAFASQDSTNATKDQVVYVKTDATGAQTGVYVVNALTGSGKVTDSGAYAAVTNLTDSQNLENDGARSVELTDGQTFYYQGDLSEDTSLPWNVTIEYRLDGEAVHPEDLAGKSGRLQMTLSITANNSTDTAYADNYLLQVSGTFAEAIAKNLVATGATRAYSGSDSVLSYMVLPGKDAEYTVQADVTDFAFDGWKIIGVPLSLALDLDDSELTESTSQLTQLEDGIATVNDATAQVDTAMATLARSTTTLSSGSEQLYSAASTFASALGQVDASSQTLASAACILSSSAGQAASGANDLSSKISSLLLPGMQTLAQGSANYSAQLGSQAQQAQAAADSIDVSAAQAGYVSAQQAYMQAYTVCLRSGADPTTDPTVIAQAAQAQAALGAYVQAQAASSAYSASAQALQQAQSGYSQINDGMQATVDGSDTSIQALASGANELSDGVEKLSEGSQALAEGVGNYTGAVTSLNSGYAQLQTATGSLAQGAKALSSGSDSLSSGASSLAAGTAELRDKTTDLDQQMIDSVKDKLQDYLNPDFETHDFVDPSNTDIETVQFVIMTEEICEPETVVEEQSTQEDSGFFAKLLALFGLR